MSDYLRVRLDMMIDSDGRAKYKRYTCPWCKLLLTNAVQPSCGHWMCQGCADELFKSAARNGGRQPCCLKDDCQEELETIDGSNYFPDHFVRKDILRMVVACVNHKKGCLWTGKYSELKVHVNECQYNKFQCEHCGLLLDNGEEKGHERVCPKALRRCPFAGLGCTHTEQMSNEDLQKHIAENMVDHLDAIASIIHRAVSTGQQPPKLHPNEDGGYHSGDFDEKDCVKCGVPTRTQALPSNLLQSIVESDEPGFRGAACAPPSIQVGLQQQDVQKIVTEKVEDLRRDLTQLVSSQMSSQSEEIGSVRSLCTKVERNVRAKNTEIEDNNFRLSLLENCNHDGSMIWKIPQISQRMSDAQNGKYTSIFSLPFYTSRYGYKMCMRLYILGDGIGKGSHMSLFFVLMKGEFDNILQWPFTHKVTFKLINQAGGRDVVDTFQPDPMSSSFRKPRSDMNIASGCPQFVSLHDLKNNGFIVDDTIFVKCTVDRSTIRHP